MSLYFYVIIMISVGFVNDFLYIISLVYIDVLCLTIFRQISNKSEITLAGCLLNLNVFTVWRHHEWRLCFVHLIRLLKHPATFISWIFFPRYNGGLRYISHPPVGLHELWWWWRLWFGHSGVWFFYCFCAEAWDLTFTTTVNNSLAVLDLIRSLKCVPVGLQWS